MDADCDGADLTVDFLVDGKVKATKTVTGNRTKTLMPLPGAIGYSWRLRVSYTGIRRPKLYGANTMYTLLGAA